MSPAPDRPNSFIRLLPKAELHLHLEGAIQAATLLELKHRHGQSGSLAEVEKLYRYSDFDSFLMAFKAVTEHLRSPEDYELITYGLMQQLKEENILHAEIYVSVGVCLWRNQDFPAIFEGLERGRQRGERDFGISVLWIFDAVRHFGAEAAQKVFELAVRYRDRNVIAVGIGGDEQKAKPELFRDSYAYAADNGLHLTAHAGETAGPESIWGAINLRAERIGHGLTAAQDPDLVEELAQRQVPIEICITSNVRTGCCKTVSEHPVKQYFDHGLMITVNTDDPAMFGTTLSHEYQLAQQAFAFTDEHLRELARNSFEASFLPAEKKLEFLNLFDAAIAR
ncbi:MAG: adenosine deaminase [Acidobacteria bacterium]|jgi:aminodeoxyfutalosine deaminase|nr:MAG: adenosine deaminase [Acidobacteriota bacterium]